MSLLKYDWILERARNLVRNFTKTGLSDRWEQLESAISNLQSQIRDRTLVHHDHIQRLLAPLQRFLVRREEDIDVVALNRPAAIHDFDAAAGVAGDDDLGPKMQARVGGDEVAVVVVHQLAAGGDAGGVFATALGAGAISGDEHLDDAAMSNGGGRLNRRVVHQLGLDLNGSDNVDG